MLDYNIFSHQAQILPVMPHFNVFITEPVTTGLDRFFVVLVHGPCFLGPDLEALLSRAIVSSAARRAASSWRSSSCDDISGIGIGSGGGRGVMGAGGVGEEKF